MGLVGLMDACGALKDLAAQNNVELPENDNPADIAKLVNTYEFTLAGSADELTPQLIQGDLDVLCVPANLAATLYQKTEGEVTVLCVNTLGVPRHRRGAGHHPRFLRPRRAHHLLRRARLHAPVRPRVPAARERHRPR